MADIILSPIAELIIETLGSAAVQEIKSLYAAKSELRKLESTLSTIRAVLVDAEKRQIGEEQVRDWLEKLEAVLFDADDLVDDVKAEFLRRQLTPGKNIRKKVSTFFSSNNQLVFRHKMAREIKTIRERLDAISADKDRFHLAMRQEVRHERNERETGAFVDEENVVGREREKMEILKRVMLLEAAETGSSSRRERVSVIPIVGLGGLGKTTLAQVVYNDKEVKKHFNLRLWVCVADNIDNDPLIVKVVRSITNTSTEPLSMPKLEEIVDENIDGKRFLLVLDVWKQEINQEWEKLRGLLGKNCVEGSRIIITTRDDMVARVMGGVRPYHLGHLDSVDSWNLFRRKAFEHGQEPTNPAIMDTAKKILDKCGGVPLAISMIGRMLCFRDPEREWPSFLRKELSNIPQEENEILPTLKLSYDYLPSHFKPCFAYCSLFPKDHEFDVQTLIILWIAQGFMMPSQSQSLEEIGYEYFKDLLWRSFFHEAKKDERNMVTTCKMHDLVHDLAIQVAGERYAMLASYGENSLRKQVRHVSFDFNSHAWLEKVPSSWLQAQRVRSFLFQSEHYAITFEIESIWVEVISNLKFLRMLDLHNVGISIVPDTIGKLMHLRYLDLSINNIERLPASITKLVNLQTLKLNWCKFLYELPSEIEKLVNLRHLELMGCDSITHMPRGLGQLTNLQTLSRIVLGESIPKRPCFKLDELMGLNNLRGNLEIKGIKSGMVTTATELIKEKPLQSLYLYFEHSKDNASNSEQEWRTTLECLQPHPNLRVLSLEWYGGSSLSSLLPTLTNLVKLELMDCSKCQQLPSLDEFLSLKEMKLSYLPSLEYITISEGDNYFSASSSRSVSVLPSLEKLKLMNLPKFRGWWRSGMEKNQVEQLILPSFPRLSTLIISNCKSLTSLPRYPNIEGELRLSTTCWKTFEQTSMAEEASSSSSSSTTTIPRVSVYSSYPLSKLTSLDLDDVTDIEYFPDVGMKGLASLKKLNIRRCRGLKYLTPCIQYLTSLEELEIKSCKEFQGIKWPETPALTSLRTLEFVNLPQLVTLPGGLQFLTTLKDLHIWYCDNFTVLPDWICKLYSLKTLHIWECPNFQIGSISSLTSLQDLGINGKWMNPREIHEDQLSIKKEEAKKKEVHIEEKVLAPSP